MFTVFCLPSLFQLLLHLCPPHGCCLLQRLLEAVAAEDVKKLEVVAAGTDGVVVTRFKVLVSHPHALLGVGGAFLWDSPQPPVPGPRGDRFGRLGLGERRA